MLEYIDGDKKTETAFHPINSLHYCAAVRYVNVTGYAIEGGGERFLPLDSPFASGEDSQHPPIFAAIFRRTTGIKVSFEGKNSYFQKKHNFDWLLEKCEVFFFLC